MRAFDPEEWRGRAWDRFRSLLETGEDRKLLEIQWATDVLAISDLGKLVTWCVGRGVTVSFGKKQNGVYDTATKTIVISAHARPLRQVAYLLHECGHHLIGDDDHHGRFEAGYPCSEDPAASKTFKHKLSCLEEEMEAWHRGWKLAIRVGLHVSREQYDEIRIECLKSYVKWAATDGRKKQ